MSADNLKRLAMKLLATKLAEDSGVYVPCDDTRNITSKLPSALGCEVENLVGELRSVIPNDFVFWLFFEIAGLSLTVEFEDGNTGSSAADGTFTSRKSMLRKMRAINWDEKRSELIAQGSIFEKLVSEADDRPANIPSSEAAAQRYGIKFTAEVGKNRRLNPRSPFTVIFAREDMDITSEQFTTLDEVVHSVADLMTTQHDILAIMEQCMPLPYEEVEKLKNDAVEQLGPISRAKAERRFGL